MGGAYRTEVHATSGNAIVNSITATITPALNDLFIVACELLWDNVTFPTITDNNGGTYTLISTWCTTNTNTSLLCFFIRNSLLPNTSSTIVTCDTSAMRGSTGSLGYIEVLAFSGFNVGGTANFVQAAKVTTSTSNPISTTFSANANTNNVILSAVAVFGDTGGAGHTAPGCTTPSGMTQHMNAGDGAGNGLQTASQDNGFSGTLVDWNTAATASLFGAALTIELTVAPGADLGIGLPRPSRGPRFKDFRPKPVFKTDHQTYWGIIGENVPAPTDANTRQVNNIRLGVGNWAPSSLGTALHSWYRADRGTTIATGVSQWNDLSGNGHTMTQGAGGNQPTLNSSDSNYNNQATIVAASAGFWLNSATFTALTQPFTLIVVGEFTPNGNVYAGSCGSGGGSGANDAFIGGGSNLSLYGGSNYLVTGVNPSATPSVMFAEFNDPSNLISKSNFIEKGTTSDAQGGSGTHGYDRNTIFADSAGLFKVIGKCAEFIVVNRVLTQTEKIYLAGYLQNRYAITIPGSATGTMGDSVSAPTDANTRQFIGSRSISESIGAPTDADARQFIGGRSISENIGAPTDAIVRSVVNSRSQSENIGAPTDANTRSVTKPRAMSESINAPTDADTRVFIGARTQTESINATTDSVARAQGRPRSISESINAPTDANSPAGSAFARTQTESINAPTDANARAQGRSRFPTENVGAPTDSIISNHGYTRVSYFHPWWDGGPTGIQDSNSRAFIGARSQSENVPAPTDSVARIHPTPYSKSQSENVAAPTDANNDHPQTLNRGASDSILAPTCVQSNSQTFTRSVALGNVSTTDATTRNTTVSRSNSESIVKPTDAMARTPLIGRNLIETAPASDANARHVVNSRTQVENISVSDAVARLMAAVRTQTENKATTDANTRAFVGARAQSETTTLTDGLTRKAGFPRAIAETTPAPTDVCTNGPKMVRAIAETIAGTTDALTRSQVLARNIPEAQTTTDGNSRHAVASRTMAESISCTDALGRSQGRARTMTESISAPMDIVAQTVIHLGTGFVAVTVSQAKSTKVALPPLVVPDTNVAIAQTKSTLVKIRTVMNPLYVGDVNDIDLVFTDGHTGANVDPTTPWTVTIQRIADSSGNPVSDVPIVFTYNTDLVPVIKRLGTGWYRANVPCSASGRWKFVAVTPGPIAASAKGGFYFVDDQP